MWRVPFDTAKAREAQRLLAKMVSGDPPIDVDSVCGMDVAYRGEEGSGAAVVMSYPGLEVLETEAVSGKAPVPYIPTFLAFREMPFLVAMLKRLQRKPAVFILNGHGAIHPAGLGLASHFGVAFDLPTIGVARSPLLTQGAAQDGGVIRVGGKEAGAVIPSPGGGRLYVSPGHRMSLDFAVRIVKGCMRGHSLPEPLFLADAYSRRAAGGRG